MMSGAENGASRVVYSQRWALASSGTTLEVLSPYMCESGAGEEPLA